MTTRKTVQNAALATAGLLLGYAAWRAAQALWLQRHNRSLQRGQRLVVLGAGFGGVQAARELAALLPNAGDAEIILVDEHDYQLFTPMLTEVAGGEIAPRHVVSPLRRLLPRIRFEQGHVEAVELTSRRVTLRTGTDQAAGTRALDADHLILAFGSVANYRGVPGVQEHAFTIKSVSDAAAIRARLLALLERANAAEAADERRALLTVVVGGAGYTGVETMAAINDLLRDSVRHYPRVRPDEVHTLLVDPGERILPELSASLAAYARQELQRRQVEIWLKTKITAAGAGYVEVEGRRRVPTGLFVWAGGVTPGSLVRNLDCAHGRHGGIQVEATGAVSGKPNVWAIGDCAELPQPGTQHAYAPTAQNATREGAWIARNLVAVLRGEQPKPFTYRPLGELALVGKHAGVANILGWQFSGWTAWALWRLIYLAKMPDPVQRYRILLDWLIDLACGPVRAAS